MTPRQGPLAGLRVVEMAGLGPAPFCGMLLADLGADVVRIDRLERADLGLPRDPAFDVASRGKRSVALDLKADAGRDAALALIARADALIEGFRPGVMERLGLGPAACHATNPGLVYGRLTGWGQDGPLAQAAGHDMNYIAITGALDAIGTADGPPVAPLNLVGDFAGGSLYLAFGVVSALFERGRSGRGQVVDAAIVDGVSHLLANAWGQLAGGYWAERRGEHVVGGAAPWNTTYRAADGRWLSLCAIEGRFWDEFVRRLQLDAASLPDRMDRAQWPALRALLAARFATEPLAHWCALLEGTDACFAPVLPLREAAAHPQMQARGVVRSAHGIDQPAPAPRFDRTPGAIQGPPLARPGQDGDEALHDWGFAADDIGALRRAGILGPGPDRPA